MADLTTGNSDIIVADAWARKVFRFDQTKNAKLAPETKDPDRAARLPGSPISVAADGAGCVYVAISQAMARTSRAHIVLKVDPYGVITTAAGCGKLGFSGDGGPAVSARLGGVSDIATDRWGNLYIADLVNHRIRVVDKDGTIRTVAGNGRVGTGGDGGPAVRASLGSYGHITVGPDGELYIGDIVGRRIRRVGSQGIISTLIGNSRW